MGALHAMTQRSKRIAFVHPDLGIGGAERLVVDAAVGLQKLGLQVTVYTSHCDKSHCFDEVSNGTLKVVVYGDFLPTNVVGKLHILFAIARQLYLVLKMIATGEIRRYDYFIVDQLSFCVPLLELFGSPDALVLFYCHFPDQLLAQKGSLLKSIYRYPFDRLEEWSTGLSDRIVVNSNFTKSVFHRTFLNLARVDPAVIYPCVDLAGAATDTDADREITDFMKLGQYFLSINRFERKKNIGLAIRAFARFKEEYQQRVPRDTMTKPRLIVAGGYDPRVFENVDYLRELETLCHELNLKLFTVRGKLLTLPPSTDVLFLPSIKLSIKTSLIKHCSLLLYTPSFEHFGIVPVEGMLCQVPVLGVNNGGPLESIVNYEFTAQGVLNATGYVSEPNDSAWSAILVRHFFEVDDDIKRQMGQNGLVRVQKIFLRDEMSRAFMRNLCDAEKLNKGLLFKVLQFWKLDLLLVVLAISWIYAKL